MFGGVSGDADEAVLSFVSGNLNYNPEVAAPIMNTSIPAENIIVVKISMAVTVMQVTVNELVKPTIICGIFYG